MREDQKKFIYYESIQNGQVDYPIPQFTFPDSPPPVDTPPSPSPTNQFDTFTKFGTFEGEEGEEQEPKGHLKMQGERGIDREIRTGRESFSLHDTKRDPEKKTARQREREREIEKQKALHRKPISTNPRYVGVGHKKLGEGAYGKIFLGFDRYYLDPEEISTLHRVE